MSETEDINLDKVGKVAVDTLVNLALNHLDVNESHQFITHIKALLAEGATALIAAALEEHFQSPAITFKDLGS